MPRTPTTRRVRRQGTVLLWVTVFLFVLLALAALIVDGGLALLTRRQLQTAANVAALEGARRPVALGDAEHREAVIALIDQLFDDDLHATGEAEEADQVDYGAGPVWEYAGGTALPGTEYRAGPRVTQAAPGYFRPHLAANVVANDASGDLVRGTYDRAPADHRESGDYSRADFTPSANGSAFLARVRRTGESLAGDIGTAGPRLPYLFGRAPAGNTTAWYDERERGMAIRGTAIADLAPVVSAGPAYSRSMYAHQGVFANDQDLVGLAPWAVRLEAWNGGEVRIDVNDLSFTSDVRLLGATRLGVAVDNDDDALVVSSAAGFPDAMNVPFVVRIGDELLTVTAVSGGTTWTVNRAVRGTQAADHSSGAIVTRVERLTVGTLLDSTEPLDWQSTAAGLRPADGEGIVPIFATRLEFGERIVGFGRATWRTDGDELIVTPSTDQTAAANANATAHFPRRLPTGITNSRWTALMSAQRDVSPSLRAPVFVRATE